MFNIIDPPSAEAPPLAFALWYARCGFRVFRLKPGAKTPAHKGWQQEATTDQDTIRLWFESGDYNIGVLTGDGLVVLDVDIRDDKLGKESLLARLIHTGPETG